MAEASGQPPGEEATRVSGEASDQLSPLPTFGAVKPASADVSPMTKDPPKLDTSGSYFPPVQEIAAAASSAATAATASTETAAAPTAAPSATTTVAPAARHLPGDALSEGPETSSSSGGSMAHPSPQLPVTLDLGNSNDTGGSGRWSRRLSVMFRQPTNPTLPQGTPKRIQYRSPSPGERFRHHVGFDNIPVGEPTRSNSLSYTLSISHRGYHPRRRSRTMMVGIDQHVYSDFALQWLLDEYADNGDEIICVHVTESVVRMGEAKNYKAQAEAMVERIKTKIPGDCAISVKLEYSVGKLHATFQKLISVYQPSMLVVGTKGRSLGGFQGLVNTNSFSKYCLQYSPIPTVVVRDYEKRKKKKEKRTNDPTRQSYASMLAATDGVHEANLEGTNQYNIEARLSPAEEAHKVAAAIGLPASFDPTLKPIDVDAVLGRRSRTPSPSPTTSPSSSPTLKKVVSAPAQAKTAVVEESDDEESEEEFGEKGNQNQKSLQAAKESQKQQKKKLHEMEVGEAAALFKKVMDESDDDDDDDNGGTKT